MINKASQKVLGLVVTLVFLNGCGSSILLDTPQAANTIGTSLATDGPQPTSTLATTAEIVTATVGQSTATNNTIPTGTETSIPLTQTAPGDTSHSVACVTSQIGTGLPAEVQADTLIFSSYTLGPAGPKLPIANGQEILFSDMSSFEVIRISENPYRITVSITFFDGQSIEEDVPVFNSTDASLAGKAQLGSFSILLSKVKKVEFKLQGGC